jgi:hypothetical protein
MDGINLHIMCICQHHTVEDHLLHLNLPGFLVGSSFCQENLQRGGVCIFIGKDKCFKKLHILYCCKEQVLEISAVQVETKTSDIINLSLYRAPSGDFSQFIKRLYTALRYLHNPKFEFLIYGDLRIDYLNENNQKTTYY